MITLQTFGLRQTDGEHIKSRIIYPSTSPSVHKVGKNVSWVVFWIAKIEKPLNSNELKNFQLLRI